MSNLSRRKAMGFVALSAVAVGAAQAWRPRLKLADQRPALQLETAVPTQFADWRVDDRQPVQIVSPDQAALLNKLYNQTLSRTYRNAAGDRVMLSIAYGGDQSDATRAHRPEVCYPAQGFQVMDSRTDQLVLADHRPLPVRRLVTRLASRNEPVTYWTLVGDKVTLSGTQQKLAQLSYSTRGVIPDGILVRVSSIDTDSDAAFRLQAGYIAALAQAVGAPTQVRLFGASTA